jgi:hypothetical protein
MTSSSSECIQLLYRLATAKNKMQANTEERKKYVNAEAVNKHGRRRKNTRRT